MAKTIRVIVAGTNAQGVPTFCFFKVNCSQKQYDLGEHYDAVKDKAIELGYETPMVEYDENEGPNWLFSHFPEDGNDVNIISL